MGKRKGAKAAEQTAAAPPPASKKAKGNKETGIQKSQVKTADGNVPKRLEDPLSILSDDFLAGSNKHTLKQQYAEAQPYLHCVMKNLFKPELLKQVREEVIHNINATYKETDLFKVFQTGDFGNLDKLDKDAADKLPMLMSLKDALYSDEFRAFIREVTGCGELADKTDCSCNVYAHGGHLLCHDDVIGTRRVSWIIYLTDPDEPWTHEDGGALELYPCEKGVPHIPEVHPTVSHLPTFNTMAMFTVQPGKSFHSVQEVFTSEKPRMSISGWYHAPHEPEDMHKASLQQLQARAGGKTQTKSQDGKADAPDADKQDGGISAGQDNFSSDQYEPFIDSEGKAVPINPIGGKACEAGNDQKAVKEEEPPTLTEDDLAFLIRYVNPTYLSEAAWPKIQAKFREDGSVQLQQFLSKSLASRVLAATKTADTTCGLGDGKVPRYEAGVCAGWSPVGPPHKQRYMAYGGQGTTTTDAGGSAVIDGGNMKAATAQEGQITTGAPLEGEAAACKSAGDLLAQVRDQLFKSDAFKRLIACFTTLGMVGQRGEVRRFRPGLDYTVAHYGIITKDPRLDVVLAFVDSGVDGPEPHRGPTAWDDGEVGGFEAYLLADEEGEGAAAEEVYKVSHGDAEDSGVLNVSAAANSLNLVLRDEGLMKFVKYVSAAAPGSRWDIAMEYLPEDDDDEEEEEEEEKGHELRQQQQHDDSCEKDTTQDDKEQEGEEQKGAPGKRKAGKSEKKVQKVDAAAGGGASVRATRTGAKADKQAASGKVQPARKGKK